MPELKHSPGPWVLTNAAPKASCRTIVLNPDDLNAIVRVYGRNRDADAHLVEQAPKLLAALKRMVAVGRPETAEQIAAETDAAALIEKLEAWKGEAQ
jgi:hypothetical protein